MPTQDDQNRQSSPPVQAYSPRRTSEPVFLDIRGLRYHVRRWPAEPAHAAGTFDTSGATARVVFLLHGWMDMSASFQFVADLLPAHWTLLAPDWRGFGLTERPAADCYWMPDYLGDLDALLDALVPSQAVDIVGHSMGGNVAILYAGVRPERVRRLVNLEGLGLPASRPDEAPSRYRKWLDELRRGARMRDYDSREAVARRLMQNNPGLDPGKAEFLAGHWSAPTSDGRFALASDPAHKIINPVLYRADEVLEVWRQISAEVLWVIAEHTSERHRFIHAAPYQERLAAIRALRRETVAGAGHMLHHDQPGAVAALIQEFLS